MHSMAKRGFHILALRKNVTYLIERQPVVLEPADDTVLQTEANRIASSHESGSCWRAEGLRVVLVDFDSFFEKLVHVGPRLFFKIRAPIGEIIESQVIDEDKKEVRRFFGLDDSQCTYKEENSAMRHCCSVFLIVEGTLSTYLPSHIY